MKPKILSLLLLWALATVEAHQHGFEHKPFGHGNWELHGPQPYRKPTQPPRPTTSRPTQASTSSSKDGSAVETRSMAELYAAALAEGGRAIVYAGGDTAGQQDYFKNQFEQAFPNTTLDMVVDYSKYHDARIDIQLANSTLVPDVVQLQTLQDFPQWKNQGVLLRYKPRSWDAIYDEFKDPDGYYIGMYIIAFTNCINKNLLPDPSSWPREAEDYLRPELKGNIALSYPNDDDAVLFLFKQIVDKYGWDYMQKFAAQNVTLSRGTHSPGLVMRQNLAAAAPAVSCGMLDSPDSPTVMALPKKDPFVTWPQTAAIFKDAKHPATAKLYLNWITEKSTQESGPRWSTRRDVAPPQGYKGIFEYQGQSDPTAFGRFMADRGAVERFRTQIQLYLGEVQGEPSPGHLGLYPETALPH